MAAVDELITATLERNASMSQVALQAMSSAMSAASGRISPPAGYFSVAPALRAAPPAFNPNTDLSVDFRNAYDEAFADFDPKVLEAVVDFVARFFPAALAQVCDDWIQNAIVNGGTGIPPAIETAIWERARGRELVEAARLEQEANPFARWGFAMPPQALAARVYEAQRDAENMSSTINRDIAIKAADVEIANIRFAIEQGLKVRLTVIGAIGDYIRAWLKPAEEAVDYASALVSAKERLWNEAANYYRAMIDEARMKLESQRITAGSRDAMVGYDVASFTRFVNTQTRAALAVAKVFGKALAGAQNATGVTVGQSLQFVGPNAARPI